VNISGLTKGLGRSMVMEVGLGFGKIGGWGMRS